MKRRLLILALALGALVATPGSAAGAETIHFSFKGQSAEAFFRSTDSSGCVVTAVNVFAADGRIKETGHPEVESLAAIVIEQFDECIGTTLLAARAEVALAAGAFQINTGLTKATLNATIEVFDRVSGTSFPVDVSLSWTGIGDITREKERFHHTTPSFKLNFRLDGSFRDAIASGTVSDGTTNYTPGQAIDPEMGSVKQGAVTIIDL